jgi:hypothetical protein
MKHILLFEDYSDEELRDLQDDLEKIGHKSRLTLGEDFGFGGDSPFKEVSSTFFRKLILTEETGKILIEKDILVPSGVKTPNLPYGVYFLKDFIFPPKFEFYFELNEIKKELAYVLYGIFDYSTYYSIKERREIYLDISNKIIKNLEEIRI